MDNVDNNLEILQEENKILHEKLNLAEKQIEEAGQNEDVPYLYLRNPFYHSLELLSLQSGIRVDVMFSGNETNTIELSDSLLSNNEVKITSPSFVNNNGQGYMLQT